MKLRQLILTLIFFLFSANTFAQPSAASELAKRLSAYKTYQANFTQATFSNGGRQNSNGKFYLQRPGKFRWEINSPNRQIIIANGKTLWMFEVDLQQVTKQAINMRSANNPAVLLSGQVGQLIKSYRVSKVQLKGKSWYQLVPRSKRSSFLMVRMRFRKNSLVAIWLKNNLDQTSLFQFSNIKINLNLKPSLFNFKPPPGVDVLQ